MYELALMLSLPKVAIAVGSLYLKLAKLISSVLLFQSSTNSTEGKSICGLGSAKISLITISLSFAI
jgi:hypothetical protein